VIRGTSAGDSEQGPQAVWPTWEELSMNVRRALRRAVVCLLAVLTLTGLSAGVAAASGPYREDPTDGLATAEFIEPNGCGAGVLAVIIPNQPGGFNFTDACNFHDRCYGTIGKTQQECDLAFYNGMQAACTAQAVGALQLAACQAIARAYYNAVILAGGPFHSAAQRASRTALAILELPPGGVGSA
jgi:hypothetical protein